MAVHIEKLTSEVMLQDGGDLPLSPAQVERLVGLVLARLEDRAREARRSQAATALCRQASKPLRPGHGA
jgi:hypothetical protein